MLTGHGVNFKCALQIEFDPRKREWLAGHCEQEILLDDVTSAATGTNVNHMNGQQVLLPEKLAVYSYGFSCKDLSGLNNHSRAWSKDCVSSGQGSTGATWKGNLAVVAATRPWIVLMENVPSAAKGRNWLQMQTDLEAKGYTLFKIVLNACHFGLPQDRLRAWFSAIRTDVMATRDDSDLPGLIDLLRIPQHLPLHRFILPPGNTYLQRIIMERSQISVKKAKRDEKAAASIKKGKVTKKKKKQSGKKWVADHWKVRRLLDMPEPPPAPAHIEDAAFKNGMGDREVDLLRIIEEGPSRPDATVQPTVELKHSAPRVVGLSGAKKKKYQGSTSCLLPTSRMMVLPPTVPELRYLTGMEALCIQGVGGGSRIQSHGFTDRELLHLAGNAFSAGCFAAVFIATLAHVDLSRL